MPRPESTLAITTDTPRLSPIGSKSMWQREDSVASQTSMSVGMPVTGMSWCVVGSTTSSRLMHSRPSTAYAQKPILDSKKHAKAPCLIRREHRYECNSPMHQRCIVSMTFAYHLHCMASSSHFSSLTGISSIILVKFTSLDHDHTYSWAMMILECSSKRRAQGSQRASEPSLCGS